MLLSHRESLHTELYVYIQSREKRSCTAVTPKQRRRHTETASSSHRNSVVVTPKQRRRHIETYRVVCIQSREKRYRVEKLYYRHTETASSSHRNIWSCVYTE